MKKWVALFFICSLASISPQTTVSPQFSELKGMEDQQGNTHLFYRIYSSYSNDPFYDTNNDIYHFDLTTFSDSLFLADYSHSDPVMSYFRTIKDYTFWNDDFTKYIFCGSMGSWEPGPYIKRFDSDYIFLNYLCCEVNQIDISSSDDSLIYSGGWLDNGSSLRSTDGGFNWDTISESFKFISLNPVNDNVLFAFDNGDDLLKSSDGGNSFYLIDTTGNYNWEKFIYDTDEDYIYRTTFKYPFHFLIVSGNQGEAFSWQTKYSSDSEIFISNDESVSGTIYLADKKNIFISTDFGNNFSLYKSLDRKIVGIYKKPNSNKLYAATKYKIYEITPDTIQVIKNLPIPDKILNYYPLAIGNKWVFHHSTVTYNPYPNYSYQIDVKEVLGDTIAPNGKYYYKVNDETIWESFVLERVDSSEGKVYRYYEDPSLPENEYLAYDLLAEIGDTIASFRMGFNTVMFTTMYAEATFNKFGLTKPKKVFEEYTLHPPIFSLTQDIGLDSIYSYFDFGETYITLKGCIIDGVVYGDTTTVGVEGEEPPIANEFRLEQNYPNPFNPSTVISYRLPVTSNVILKVYDVLGNEIATLFNEEKPAGEYEVEFNAHGLPSGIYFYQLKTGEFIQTKKMILLK
jgi:hypothetical protein